MNKVCAPFMQLFWDWSYMYTTCCISWPFRWYLIKSQSSRQGMKATRCYCQVLIIRSSRNCVLFQRIKLHTLFCHLTTRIVVRIQNIQYQWPHDVIKLVMLRLLFKSPFNTRWSIADDGGSKGKACLSHQGGASTALLYLVSTWTLSCVWLASV